MIVRQLNGRNVRRIAMSKSVRWKLRKDEMPYIQDICNAVGVSIDEFSRKATFEAAHRIYDMLLSNHKVTGGAVDEDTSNVPSVSKADSGSSGEGSLGSGTPDPTGEGDGTSDTVTDTAGSR